MREEEEKEDEKDAHDPDEEIDHDLWGKVCEDCRDDEGEKDKQSSRQNRADIDKEEREIELHCQAKIIDWHLKRCGNCLKDIFPF